MRSVPLAKATRLVNAGSLVVVSSSAGGRETFTPVAWQTPVESDPPLVAVIVDRGHFVAELVRRSRVFCLSLPTVEMLEAVRLLGKVSGREKDKVALTGVEVADCARIACRYLAAAAGRLECRLERTVRMEGVDVLVGRVVHAAAVPAFRGGVWDLSKVRLLHHLGGGIFGTLRPL